MAQKQSAAVDDDDVLDSLTIGRRIRQLRVDRGLTLDALATAIGRAPSQVSVIENGKRELKLGELQKLAQALGTTLDELLSSEPPSRRAALEIALERAQRGPLYASLPLPALPVRKTLSDEAIETILGLHDELERLHRERAATPEEARRANTELRAEQRKRGNYFPELERTARDLLAAVGHRGGPLSQRTASDLAAHLGFTLHYVADLPSTTRSVTDQANGRIYLPVRQSAGDPRSELLQALAAHVLGSPEPQDFAEFLRQRVETNYLAGALMLPEQSAVDFLTAAKEARELSVEDLRDAFAVSYETAAHRFTNLATQHLGLPVHFLKVHESGALSKAYENDGVAFPTDALGAVEGQFVCRKWSARQVFDVEDRFSPYHQYTDKPAGTSWCTSSIQSTATGVLGERRHTVRARQVVPRARHDAADGVAVPGSRLLPAAPERTRGALGRQGVAERAAGIVLAGGAADRDLHRRRPHRGLRVPRGSRTERIVNFSIDTHDATPPFEQLRQQVLEGISDGSLAPGTKLPTVRALAEQLGLATNTVARSYRELEIAGVIETRGRSGSFIAMSTDAAAHAAQEAAATYASRTRALGVSPDAALDYARAALIPR